MAAGTLAALRPAVVRAGSEQAAADAEGKADDVVYLFVQSARGAKLADGKLTLSGVTPATLYFSDRPERITGHTPTEDFVANWGIGEDSFASEPPNAELSILTGELPQEIVVMLRNPVLDGDTLTYDAEVLEGDATASGGASSLFIDVIGRPMTPVSVAGVHRRRRRRVRRAVR